MRWGEYIRKDRRGGSGRNAAEDDYEKSQEKAERDHCPAPDPTCGGLVLYRVLADAASEEEEKTRDTAGGRRR